MKLRENLGAAAAADTGLQRGLRRESGPAARL